MLFGAVTMTVHPGKLDGQQPLVVTVSTERVRRIPPKKTRRIPDTTVSVHYPP